MRRLNNDLCETFGWKFIGGYPNSCMVGHPEVFFKLIEYRYFSEKVPSSDSSFFSSRIDIVVQSSGGRFTIIMGADSFSKEVLKEGIRPPCTDNDTKVKFFYKVTKASDGTVVDDNNASGEPLELVFGKQFKLEVWEECLKTMKLHEIAQFSVEKDQLNCYPLVAKSLRDIAKGKDPRKKCDHDHETGESGHHCCGMQKLMENGLGYPDLDELMKNPQDLNFLFELVEVQEPGTYVKDSWAMDYDEKMQSVPLLHQEGNHLYCRKKYVEAAERYSRALAALEELQGKEKPESEEWNKLADMMTPILLNYVQCQLILGHYNEAIDHATTIIDRNPKNVKAWYRRAKAHAMAWNPKEARENFAVALSLDPELKGAITKDLKDLDRTQAIRDTEDREKMRKLFG